MICRSPSWAFHTAPLFWVTGQKPWTSISMTAPRKMSKMKRAMPQVRWTLISMSAWVRKRTPLGACITHCQLTGTAEGITPCIGSITEFGENSANHRTNSSASLCLVGPPNKMPFPTEIGVVKWRKPWKEGMMPPRSRK